MITCKNCGTQFDESTRFCPTCGSPVGSQSTAADPNKAPSGTSVQQDAQNNKLVAVLAYCFCLFFIPLVAAKDSKFAHFHAVQGFNVFILWLIDIIVFSIISNAVLWNPFSLGAWGAWGIVSILSTIVGILIAVLAIIGIINALKGEMKELPVVGKWRIIK